LTSFDPGKGLDPVHARALPGAHVRPDGHWFWRMMFASTNGGAGA
jgi:hypothetical protein